MHDHGDIAHFRIAPPRMGFGFHAVFHPDGARDILTSRSYRKDAPVFTEFARMFGDGLATLEGERWRAHRRMLQPLFTRRRVADYLPVIARASDDLVDSWKPRVEQPGDRTLLDHLLTPFNRRATRRFLKEARTKVWHNAAVLSRARRQGRIDDRLAELEELSRQRVADLRAPGLVVLRLARLGFGVELALAERTVDHDGGGPDSRR